MQYVCRIGTPEGRVREEVRQAQDASDLERDLEREGYHVFSVEARGFASQLTLRSRGSRRKPVPTQDLLLFNQELAALLQAGLPLLQALDLVLDRIKDPQFRSVVAQVRDRVKSGSELSDAFGEFDDVLPPLYPSTLRAGERSGELEDVIRRFIRYQRLIMEARKKVVSALVYPAVLIGLSLAMILLMTLYVVPRFTVFYSDLNAELPLLTRVTLGVSDFVRSNWMVLSAALLVGFWLLRRWKESPSGALALDRAKLRLPLLGQIFQRFGLSEFCRSLATLLSGGIPLVPALETAVGAVGNRYLRSALHPVIQQVREGSSFHAALEESGEVEDIAVDMARVGEATGALDAMLSNVADFFDEEAETRLQRIVSLIEPIMLVLMGIIIATLLLSVYLPLFGALNQVPA